MQVKTFQKREGKRNAPVTPRQYHVCITKIDVRLPGKGNSNSHGARPVHLIITMIKWSRTSRLSIKNSLSLTFACAARVEYRGGGIEKTLNFIRLSY